MSDRTPIEGERAETQITAARFQWLTRNRILLLGGGTLLGVGLMIYQHFDQPVQKASDIEDAVSAHKVNQPTPWTAPPKTEQVAFRTQAPPKAPASIETAVTQPAAVSDTKAAPDIHPSQVSFKMATLPDALKPKPPPAPASGATPETTGVAYKAAKIAGIKAGRMGDSSFILKPGMMFCEMNTDILSDQAGSFLCTVRQPVYSDRQIPLLERGTLIRGHYASENANGQNRISGLDLIAYTPDDCVVALGGAPTDTLGAAGIAGEKNTHFWQKFGFALILTAVDVGSQIAQSALGGGGGHNNTSFNFNSGGSGIQQMTQEVLREKMHIKDTLTVNHGSEIGIMIEEPIDFTACKVS